MKTTLLLALLSFPLFLHSQNDPKPPKLRIEPGFFKTRYELGDKTTPSKAVADHLKKYEADAYYKWKEADRADRNQTLWTLVGLGGTLTGLLAEKLQTKAIGYSVGAVGFCVSIIPTINGPKRRQAAIDIYNSKYGY